MVPVTTSKIAPVLDPVATPPIRHRVEVTPIGVVLTVISSLANGTAAFASSPPVKRNRLKLNANMRRMIRASIRYYLNLLSRVFICSSRAFFLPSNCETCSNSSIL